MGGRRHDEVTTRSQSGEQQACKGHLSHWDPRFHHTLKVRKGTERGKRPGFSPSIVALMIAFVACEIDNVVACDSRDGSTFLYP